MGKASRNRTWRAGRAPAARSVPCFHGGVPGKRPREVLEPASRLGFEFQYVTEGAKYSPDWVYVTTDADVATGYASRYLQSDGQKVPGTVYEVEPLDQLRGDPDYRAFPEVFLRCRAARIVRVVQTGISLTRTEENYLERRYQVWGDPDYPVWDNDGLLIPSEQMVANGVTREWTTLLLPWLGPAEVDAKGQLTIAARSDNPWHTMLEMIPSLDRQCQIQTETHPLRRAVFYRCAACGHQTIEQAAAALHQLGEHAVRMLARIHGWNKPPVPPLVEAARARDPARWRWTSSSR